MNYSSYISVFMLGLVGSLHCAGMCGPLQSFLTKTGWRYKILYHYGRYIAYTATGIGFFFIGITSQLLAWQKYTTIGAGILVIMSLVPSFLNLPPYFKRLSSALFRTSAQSVPSIKFFMMGLANGFLPCGLVYMAASQALLSCDLLKTIMLMFLFLLGTLPALLGVNHLYTFLENHKFYFAQLKPVIVISIGILLILRGLNTDLQSTGTHSKSQTCINTRLR